MPKLVVTEQGYDKKENFEFKYEGINIGRSEENEIKLLHSEISRKHAKIIVSGSNCFLIDLGSGNGTFLNGTRLKPNEQALLRHGDMIAIENYNLNFNQLDEMLASSFNEVTDSDILEVKLLKKVLRAIDKESMPGLEVQNGNFIGKKFFIAEDISEAVIGRDDTADFDIKEYVISRQHAKIIREGGEIFIQDLNSKNGTFLNNRRVAKEALHDGDRIALGTIVLIFRDPKEASLQAIRAKAAPAPEAPAVKETEVKEATGPAIEAGEGLGFEEIEKEEPPEEYPTPAPRKERIKLSFVEIGMIGFGILILIFALIALINLILK
ncbi:MAG: FHA domain-containing protein [Deltaproteobacteria bacterium]|nr:FHA domain-containing protein [Deltaproteobacteria bacterium]